MSGIVGYLGFRSVLEVVLPALRGLERAGPAYDSAGVALLADGGLAAARTAGKVADLEDVLRRRPLPSCGTGLGHVRRATVGEPSDRNAHPQLDASGRVAVVHNGTLDNGAELRAELAARGHRLASDTDTEVIAQLVAEAFSSCGELAEALRQTGGRLRGRYALAALHADEPDVLAGARGGLPLSAAIGDGEAYLVSDPQAAPSGAPWGPLVPGDGEIVVLRRGGDDVRGEVLPG